MNQIRSNEFANFFEEICPSPVSLSLALDAWACGAGRVAWVDEIV
jgi:hypothetical protein